MSGHGPVKRVRSLHQKKFREAEGRFLVQGRKLVEELLRSGLGVEAIYATADAAAALGAPDVTVLPPHDLERMGTFEHGNELVAVVRTPAAEPPRLPGPGGLVLALDGIADPGNLGTLVRIADWFGAAEVWCSLDSVEAYNPKCVQASMGSLFRVPVRPTDLAATLTQAVAAGVHVHHAEASGTDVFQAALERPAVLVLGSESHGISADVRRVPGRSIAIPAAGGAESLNVAAAAAALCMEFLRRR